MSITAMFRAENFWYCNRVGLKHILSPNLSRLRLFWCKCFAGCNTGREKIMCCSGWSHSHTVSVLLFE